MSETKIQWCDFTHNEWEGCTKVSDGCRFCYAEARDKRHMIEDVDHWGKGAPRRRTSEANRRKPLTWNKTAICLKCGHPELLGSDDCRKCGSNFSETNRRRPRVFSASLSDWLDDEVPIEWLADLLELIRRTPNLDWLLLTKRPENWRGRLGQVGIWACGDEDEPATTDERHPIWQFTTRWLFGNAPDNVWLGTSVEDQQRADERIPILLSIPAKVRFLSCEPLLGPVDLTSIAFPEQVSKPRSHQYPFLDALRGKEAPGSYLRDAKIHWCIVGGESGPKARPFDIQWARSLRDQCQAAGVAYFLKQLGSNAEQWWNEDGLGDMRRYHTADKKGGNIEEFPLNLKIREFPTP